MVLELVCCFVGLFLWWFVGLCFSGCYGLTCLVVWVFYLGWLGLGFDLVADLIVWGCFVGVFRGLLGTWVYRELRGWYNIVFS